MRVVVAVGGNAMLERGEVPLAEVQERHIAVAVAALVPLARDHDPIITHGNGPQVGLLANESALDPVLPHPYPFDVLGAQTQGMIGYFLLQAFGNALPGQEVVSLICQTEVAAADPVYAHADAERLAESRGWQVRPDGDDWRRVVPSPDPVAMVELATIERLLDGDALVICADVAHVEVRFGTPDARPIGRTTPAELLDGTSGTVVEPAGATPDRPT